jgi:CO/xanthine dehydrogenase FAD-binding subunit
MAFSLVRPTSVDEALRLLSDPVGGPSVALAGGTDLLLDLDDGHLTAGRVVSLDRLPWKTLAWEGPTMVVGATLPLARLAADPTVRRKAPGLATAIDAVGSLALRHRATLGGNVGRAGPASDLLPILLAMGATVRLVDRSGRREVLLDQFLRGSRATHLRPGELIEAVAIPEAPVSAYVWQRVRPANDVSQVGVAVARSGDDPRWSVALGGILPVPRRMPEAEAALRSRTPSAAEVSDAAEAAAAHAPFVSDKRASEAYRRRLVAVLVRRAVEQALVAEGGSE